MNQGLPENRNQAAELSVAAATLAKIPRNRKRPWTGWLGDHDLRKGDRVIAPDGDIRSVYGAVRGFIILWKNPVPLDGLPADVYRAWQVRRHKNPNAVRLGAAKRGVTERRSLVKLEACRQNARKPAKAGSRRRGRPRKN